MARFDMAAASTEPQGMSVIVLFIDCKREIMLSPFCALIKDAEIRQTSIENK
jgi:hypothetical protein